MGCIAAAKATILAIPRCNGQMTKPPYILAIDQGTTSTRAILFDAQGDAGAAPRSSSPSIYPRPGWVEHDPEEIWRAVVPDLPRGGRRRDDGPIAAIGITNQRETTVLWERAHRPPGAQRDRLAGPAHRRAVRALARRRARRDRSPRAPGSSSTPISPPRRSAGCSTTCRGCAERAEAGEIAFGTIDSFLLWRLTRRAAPCDRRHQRRAHDAVRYRPSRLGRRTPRRVRHPARRSCPRCAIPTPISARPHPELLGAAIPIAGVAGDQQAAADRPGLLPRLAWSNRPTAPAPSRSSTSAREPAALAPSAADDDRLPARRRDGLCAGRQHLYRRRRGAMAARPARRRRRGGRDGRPRRARRPAPAALFRARHLPGSARPTGRRRRAAR